MRIVIADDEYLVQASLISMIEEYGNNWTVAGVASDGRQLVELIKRQQPDLAIVDIKMPYLSGLEAIRIGKQECPLMQWIILTGYSEFSFAQDALKLGALNYLLKPVDREELKLALQAAQQAVVERSGFAMRRFESAMTFVGHGLDDGLLEEDIKEYADLTFHVIVFYVDSGLTDNEQASRLRSFYQNVKNQLLTTIRSDVRYAFIFLPNGELALISAYANQNKTEMEIMLESLAQGIQHIVQETACAAFCLTMFCSEKLPFTALKDHIHQIQTVSLLRILYGVNKMWPLDQLQTLRDDEAFKMCKIIDKLAESFNEASHANYMNKVNELGELWETADRFADKSMKSAIATFLTGVISCQLDPNDDFALWMKRLKDRGQALLSNVRKAERPHSIIQHALLFIEKNYIHDISILQIAAELQVTPNYLSTLFHKKMGTTFIRYLTRIRLIKAQQLLRNANHQIQTVAEMVGYTNPRYFTKLFTEFTGSSPSDFKKSALRGGEAPE